MAKILLKLDNPSKVCKEFIDEFYYAVLVDDIKDLDEEGVKMLIYNTKDDFEKGDGFISYPTVCMFENWFEYTAHYVN